MTEKTPAPYGSHRRQGGRTPGLPNKNKRRLIHEIRQKFPEYDPIQAMVHIALDENNAIELRASMHKEVAKYVVPQLKSVEVSGPDGDSIQIQEVNSLRAALKVLSDHGIDPDKV